MSIKQLFESPAEEFSWRLAKISSQYLSREMANQLDALDPLNNVVSLYETCELIPLAGHSLGPGFKKTETNILAALHLQKKLHAGHFRESHPQGHESAHWFDCDRHLPSLLAAQQILGFAELDEFCFTASGLSQNLGMLLENFYRPTANDWLSGKTKIIRLGTEFFSDGAIIDSVLKRAIQTAEDFNSFYNDKKPSSANETLTIKPNQNGIYSTQAIIDFIRKNAATTQVICLPDVVFNTGQRLELEKIFAAVDDLIKQHNIKIILDLAHSVGNRPINLKSMPVTAAVGCGYKHLSGPAGSSFGIYVNRHADLTLYPPIQGWKAADPKQVFDKINQYDHTIMEAKQGAVAFRTSNPPPLSLIPVQTVLTELSKIGFDKLFQRSERLTQYFLMHLKRYFSDEIDIITPLNSAERGAMLCLRVKGEKNISIIEALLKERGFEIDTRPPNFMRVTPHYGYTTFSDIYHFVVQLRQVMNARLESIAKKSIFAVSWDSNDAQNNQTAIPSIKLTSKL